jgi:hypothetical protein
MVLNKNELKLGITSFFVLATFLGLIRVLSTYQGSKFFPLEVVVIVSLLCLTSAAYVKYDGALGERLFMLIYILALVNFLAVWYFKGAFHIVLVLVTVVGFVFTIPMDMFVARGGKRELSNRVETYYDSDNGNSKDEPRSEIFQENVKRLNSTEPFESFVFQTNDLKTNDTKKVVRKVTTKVKAAHSPGKYIASKYGNTYHEPKCEWANKINKTHQVWFAEKENAWEKGYKAHSCVN